MKQTLWPDIEMFSDYLSSEQCYVKDKLCEERPVVSKHFVIIFKNIYIWGNDLFQETFFFADPDNVHAFLYSGSADGWTSRHRQDLAC